MGRPKCGHAWTIVGGKSYMALANGEWVPTGCGVGWPRCLRCRKPEESSLIVDGLCNTCYYYHALTTQEFWDHREDDNFPYTIGSRITASFRRLGEMQRTARGKNAPILNP